MNGCPEMLCTKIQIPTKDCWVISKPKKEGSAEMRRNQSIRDGELADQLVSRSVLGSHLARAQCAETVTSYEWRMEDHLVGLLTLTLVVLPVPIKGISH